MHHYLVQQTAYERISALAGTEATLLVLLIPYIFTLSPLVDLLSSHVAQTYLHALSLASLLAFADPSPGRRLAWVTLGNGFGVLGRAVYWVNGGALQTILGLLVSVAAKSLCGGNNPCPSASPVPKRM